MSRWTPGPWFVGPDRDGISTLVHDSTENAGRPGIVARCLMESDALLIASAPDLYVALERCVEAVEDELFACSPEEVDTHPTLKAHEKAASAARAALARARGEETNQ